MMAKVALECGGDISASQEEILAHSSFLGGDNGLPVSASDEEEIFTTPPESRRHPATARRLITMCTLPFTPTPSKSTGPHSDEKARGSGSDADAALAPPSSKPQSPVPLTDDDEDDAAPVNPRHKPRDPVADFIVLARQKGIF